MIRKLLNIRQKVLLLFMLSSGIGYAQNNYTDNPYAYYNMIDTMDCVEKVTRIAPLYEVIDKDFRDSILKLIIIDKIDRDETIQIFSRGGKRDELVYNTVEARKNGIYTKLCFFFKSDDSSNIYINVESSLNYFQSVYEKPNYRNNDYYTIGFALIEDYLVEIECDFFVAEEEINRFVRKTGKNISLKICGVDESGPRIWEYGKSLRFKRKLMNPNNYVHPVSRR